MPDTSPIANPDRELAEAEKHIILLHGLGRAKGSMRTLDNMFAKYGYKTHRIAYPSRFQSIDENLTYIASKLPPKGRMALIGHSLGGVLSLKLMRALPKERRAALILLGAPVNGASIAAYLDRLGLARAIFGPGLNDLTMGEVRPGELPPTLVFAGTNDDQPYLPGYYYHRFIGDPGPNDGTVLVSETFLEGADNRKIYVGHSFMMRHPEILEQSLEFMLKHF